jgi:hypothetical protein
LIFCGNPSEEKQNKKNNLIQSGPIEYLNKRQIDDILIKTNDKDNFGESIMGYNSSKSEKVVYLCVLIFVIWFISPAWADQPTKVLIHIAEDQSREVSEDLLRSSEIKIGQKLIESGMEVATSDDLSAAPRIGKKVLAEALQGNVLALRKAAAALNAAYILNGKAKTRINAEEAVGVKLNKAVTTFTYKIINTASGKTKYMDSPTYISANQSPEAAMKSTYNKLSTDMSRKIQDMIPVRLSAAESQKLKTYISSSSSSPKQTTGPASSSKPSSAPIIAQVAENTGNQPEIIILNPPVARGFKPTLYEKKLNIEGIAIDPKGIDEVRINGEIISHDAKGHFSKSVELKDGENQFLVIARNHSNQVIKKIFSIDLEKDTVAPEVIVTSPQAARGFKVIVEPEITTSLVAGMVRDDSKISFVKINNMLVSLSENGHFSHEISIADEANLVIQAEDIYGNLTTKRFQFTRGLDDGDDPSDQIIQSGKKPVLWGLSVGVSKYKSATLDLRYADHDALLLKKFFTSQEGKSFSEVHFKTIVNQEATRENIIAEISNHLGKAAPDDIVFLSIAGHGIKHRQSGSYYFLPSDADSENILSRGLRMSDFEESIKILAQNVRKIIVAIDSCHSGALQIGMRSVGESEDLSEAIKAAQGLYILSASKGGELSMESDKFSIFPDHKGHGVFTYTLVQAMMGKADYDKNDYISLNEMFHYVAGQVPRLTNGKQHPYFKVDGTELPLVMLK